mmetsp:Transcript_3837/g.7232  ORF Transcript_3837/g.7232 Transcript_3837/m.7232 type:complete len:467 (-) Transcript_3837:116-1516(-)
MKIILVIFGSRIYYISMGIKYDRKVEIFGLPRMFFQIDPHLAPPLSHAVHRVELRERYLPLRFLGRHEPVPLQHLPERGILLPHDVGRGRVVEPDHRHDPFGKDFQFDVRLCLRGLLHGFRERGPRSAGCLERHGPRHGLLLLVAVGNRHDGGRVRRGAAGQGSEPVVRQIPAFVGDGRRGHGGIPSYLVPRPPAQQEEGHLRRGRDGLDRSRRQLSQKVAHGVGFGNLAVSPPFAGRPGPHDIGGVPVVRLRRDHDAGTGRRRVGDEGVRAHPRERCGGPPRQHLRGETERPPGGDLRDGAVLIDRAAVDAVQDDAGVGEEDPAQERAPGEQVHVVAVTRHPRQARQGIVEGHVRRVVLLVHGREEGCVLLGEDVLEGRHGGGQLGDGGGGGGGQGRGAPTGDGDGGEGVSAGGEGEEGEQREEFRAGCGRKGGGGHGEEGGTRKIRALSVCEKTKNPATVRSIQ